MTSSDFEVESRRNVATGGFLTLDELTIRSPSGEVLHRDVVRHPGGAAVLPVDGDRVWLIRIYRSALGREIIEIPAGTSEESDGAADTTARRELAEELGATAVTVEHLATIAPSPGYTDEVIELFAAEGLEFSERSPDGEEERQASVFSLPIGEALDRIDRREIVDAKTVVALLEWNRRRG